MRSTSLLTFFLVAACGDPAPLCTPPAPSKGPWVMRATETAASIYWESREDPKGRVTVVLAKESGGAEREIAGTATATFVEHGYGEDLGIKMPDLPGTWYLYRVDATGLEPGTCYSYRVRGADEARGRLCTSRAPGEPLRFMAIGDTDPILGHTLPVLGHVLPEKPDFVVHMGDVQYYSAISESWAYWFFAMKPMLRAGAFYPAVGNHEDEMVGEYRDYYDRLFQKPSLDGDSTAKWYRFRSGGVWFFSIDTEEPYDSGSAQYQWLSQNLQEAAASPGFRFSVIYMHRNLYTVGDTAPQIDQRMHLLPLLQAYKVRLVLSGHMHGYERFEVGDITFVTTAGGGGVINDVDKNVSTYPDDAALRVKAAAAYHATLFDVTPMGDLTRLRGRAIDEAGAVVDEFAHDF